jgi:hypothetical protein
MIGKLSKIKVKYKVKNKKQKTKNKHRGISHYVRNTPKRKNKRKSQKIYSYYLVNAVRRFFFAMYGGDPYAFEPKKTSLQDSVMSLKTHMEYLSPCSTGVFRAKRERPLQSFVFFQGFNGKRASQNS